MKSSFFIHKELMENILKDFKGSDSDDEEPGNCEKKD